MEGSCKLQIANQMLNIISCGVLIAITNKYLASVFGHFFSPKILTGIDKLKAFICPFRIRIKF